MPMFNRVLYSIALIAIYTIFSSCINRHQVNTVVLPQEANIIPGLPTIVDFEKLNGGCLDCQILDICRWKNRKKELSLRGEDCKVNIVCIIEANERTLSEVKQTLEERIGDCVHLVYTISSECNIGLFGRRKIEHTVLLDSEGVIICQGGNPKRNLIEFKTYCNYIISLNKHSFSYEEDNY